MYHAYYLGNFTNLSLVWIWRYCWVRHSKAIVKKYQKNNNSSCSRLERLERLDWLLLFQSSSVPSPHYLNMTLSFKDLSQYDCDSVNLDLVLCDSVNLDLLLCDCVTERVWESVWVCTSLLVSLWVWVLPAIPSLQGLSWDLTRFHLLATVHSSGFEGLINVVHLHFSFIIRLIVKQYGFQLKHF